MKKIIVSCIAAALLATSLVAVTAQPPQLRSKTQALIERRIQTLTSELKLTAAQTASVREIMTNHFTRHIALKGTSGPAAAGAAKALRASVNSRTKEILTPAQRLKLAQLRRAGIDCAI